MISRFSILLLLTGLLSPAPVRSLSQDEAPRQLWDSQFLKKRVPPRSPSTTTRKTPVYRRATAKPEAKTETRVEAKSTAGRTEAIEETSGEVLGLTIWKLRPVREADNKEARLLLQEESAATEYTPERVESETPFAAGDRVRLSIEAPRDGFLYVIDREQYSDGTTSDPYLIFPTLRNRGGDNAVKAGRLIDLPGRSAFRLTPMRPDYEGERLTIIVAPAPLEEIKAGPGMIKLDRALVEGWEQKWKASVERFELTGGAGSPYTKAEKEAGEDGSRLLTQEDEPPQTLFRVSGRSAGALLIPVSLKIIRRP